MRISKSQHPETGIGGALKKMLTMNHSWCLNCSNFSKILKAHEKGNCIYFGS